MQRLAMAQEDTARRRRKRRKAGLRTWEMDQVAPEATVTDLSASDVVISKSPSLTKHLNPTDDEDEDDDDEADNQQKPRFSAVINESARTCPICLEDILVDNVVRVLPCLHVFHANCIRLWLRRNNACPCCWQRVVKSLIRKLEPTRHILPITTPPIDEPHSTEKTPHPNTPNQPTHHLTHDQHSIMLDDHPSVTPGHAHLACVQHSELLVELRRSLRGETSLLSLNTSTGDWSDVADDGTLQDV